MAVKFPQFDTDEPLWYDNGKWGRAGYACPNPGGKTFTNNTVLAEFVSIVGRNFFELLHREDCKFYAPPHVQYWADLHQLIVTGRKRLADRVRQPSDPNGLVPTHATPTPEMFLAYPIPFFGERIRQPDIREYSKLALMLLGECMQHSDNEHSTYITPDFAAMAGKYLQEILVLFSTKYFGKTREVAYAPAFALTPADFLAYNPAAVMTRVEITEERPPQQWWPTENDLTQIRGLPINEALLMCKRWPQTDWLVQAGGNVFVDPTQQEEETTTQGSGVVPPGGNENLTGSFITPPGQVGTK